MPDRYWTPKLKAELRRMVSKIAAEPVDRMVRAVIRDREKYRGSRYMLHVRKREAKKIRRIVEVALDAREQWVIEQYVKANRTK